MNGSPWPDHGRENLVEKLEAVGKLNGKAFIRMKDLHGATLRSMNGMNLEEDSLLFGWLHCNVQLSNYQERKERISSQTITYNCMKQ